MGRCTTLVSLVLMFLGWAAATALAGAPAAGAPAGAVRRPLPRGLGFDSSDSGVAVNPATPYSADTRANAEFIRSVGSFLVDTATARRIVAEAVPLELENSKLAVKTYFERRLLNQEYRRMLDPAYARDSSRAKSPGEELYDKVRKEDLAKEMNWLILALFEQRVANNAAFMERVEGAPVDLSAEDIGHLWLSDKIDHGTVMRAGEALPLNEDWPHLLQGPAFDKARKEFEAARNEALEQIKKDSKKDYFHNEKVGQAWENLVDAFYNEYRAKLHTPEEPKPREYAEAIGFLRNLEFQVYRFVKTNFNQDAYRFTGNRLAELVDHMGARGLYFAKPKPGDEGTYQMVFIRLHDMYMKGLYRNRPADR